MSIYEECKEAVNEITYQDIRAMLRVPEVLPCAFDGGMEFWLERISFWGKLNIVHTDPTTKRRNKITKGELLHMLSDPTLLNTFGRWSVRKLTFKSVELYRDFIGQDGRKYNERVIVDIEIDPEIKKAMKIKI
jgi:hypothetical protein